MFSRVVMWPLPKGAYRSATSASPSMLSEVRMPPGTLTRIICTSAWRWPYTPCLSRKGVKTALSNSPDSKDADCSSSRTISSSMNGMIDSDDLASSRLSW